MRITFITSVLDLTGGSRIIATYARMLTAHGHKVTIVSPVPRPPSLRRRIRSLLRTGRWDLGYGGRSHFDGLGLDIRRPARPPALDAHVPDGDAVVATWWETAEWVNAMSPSKGAKVYLVQGHEVFDERHIERVRATYHMPFHKIVVSGWLQRIMADEYGDAHTSLVPNAIDHAAFDVPLRGRQPVPTVGFMYSQAALKGSHIAMGALDRVRTTHPNLRVVSFGTHEPVGVPGFDGIEFTLLPSAEGLRRAYSSCDLWLCASSSEGFGLPAMEAMGCRTPVVSTRVGWPLDAIEDGVNGYLVPVGDTDAMATAIERGLALDDGSWRAMSERAHASARAYTWDRSYGDLVVALERAIAQVRS